MTLAEYNKIAKKKNPWSSMDVGGVNDSLTNVASVYGGGVVSRTETMDEI